MEACSSVACLEKGLKELQPIEKTKSDENQTMKGSRAKRAKTTTRVRSKAQTASTCEIPILSVLSNAPVNGVSTRQVLQEVRSSKWFSELDDDDRRARYPKSKKTIVDSIIKFAKKNLVLKGEIYAVSEDKPLGIWRITQKGLIRSAMEGNNWSPRYTIHEDAILIEEEGKNN